MFHLSIKLERRKMVINKLNNNVKYYEFMGIFRINIFISILLIFNDGPRRQYENINFFVKLLRSCSFKKKYWLVSNLKQNSKQILKMDKSAFLQCAGFQILNYVSFTNTNNSILTARSITQ